MTAKKRAPAAHLEIIYRNPADIKADPRNARTHSAKQIKMLRAAIKEFGFNVPILLKPDGTVGAGHGRLQAAIEEKLDVVPTITKHGLTTKQWRAFMLADNKIAMGSAWDEKLLLAELTALQIGDFNLDLTGFSPLEMTKFGVPGFDVKDGEKAATDQIGGMKFSVIIRCKDEQHQAELLGRFAKEGLKTEALIS